MRATLVSAALLVAVSSLAGCAAPPAPPPVEAPPSSPPIQPEDPDPAPVPTDLWAPPAEGETVAADRIHELLPGFWTADWGDIVFRIEPDGTVVAAYAYDEGIIVGRLVDSVLVGWWCEIPSRLPSGDAGDVEMRLVENEAGVHIDGRWTYGASEGNWNENWDIDAISDEPAPEELVARLDVAVAECVPEG